MFGTTGSEAVIMAHKDEDSVIIAGNQIERTVGVVKIHSLSVRM